MALPGWAARAQLQVSVQTQAAEYLSHRGQPFGREIPLVDSTAQDVLYPVNINNHWGYINQFGQLSVAPQFDWCDWFYEGFARFMDGGRTGLITGNGSVYIPARFAWMDRVSEGYVIVSDGERFGVTHKSGRVVVPMRLDGALRFREGRAAVQVGDLVGFIDVRGQPVIRPRFAQARSFSQGLAAVRFPDDPDGRAGHVAFINVTGQVAWSGRGTTVRELGDFGDGLAAFRNADDRWGYMGRDFDPAIAARFDEARAFVGGLAGVRVGEHWGFIDRSGRMAVQPRWDAVDDFDDTLALVRSGETWGFIDRTGRVAITPRYSFALPFFRDYAAVERAPSFGYLGVDGSPLYDPVDASSGFVNLTARERARIEVEPELVFNRRVPPPRLREQAAVPYLPDHLYEHRLPAAE